MGESNILTGEVIEATAHRAWLRTPVGTLTLPMQATIGDMVTLSIRPEQLALGHAANDAASLGSARVSEISFQGTHLRARLDAGANSEIGLLLRAPATAGLAVGDKVEISVRLADVVLLRSA